MLRCKCSSDKYGLIENEEYEYLSFIDDDYSQLTVYNIEKYIGKFDDVFYIIGKEPMLNDVLEYLSKETTAPTSNILKNQLYYIYSKWDLSKPYLKDQSKELIDFLVEL
jgi:hypothetical protein